MSSFRWQKRSLGFVLYQDGPEYYDPPGGLLSLDLDVENFLAPASHLDPYDTTKPISLDNFRPHFDLINTQLMQVNQRRNWTFQLCRYKLCSEAFWFGTWCHLLLHHCRPYSVLLLKDIDCSVTSCQDNDHGTYSEFRVMCSGLPHKFCETWAQAWAAGPQCHRSLCNITPDIGAAKYNVRLRQVVGTSSRRHAWISWSFPPPACSCRPYFWFGHMVGLIHSVCTPSYVFEQHAIICANHPFSQLDELKIYRVQTTT